MSTEAQESEQPAVSARTFDAEMSAAWDMLQIFRMSGSEQDAREIDKIAGHLQTIAFRRTDALTDDDRREIGEWLNQARLAALDQNMRQTHDHIGKLLERMG